MNKPSRCLVQTALNGYKLQENVQQLCLNEVFLPCMLELRVADVKFWEYLPSRKCTLEMLWDH